MLFRYLVSIVILALTLSSGDSCAQSNAAGFIYGQTVDEDGDPVAAAKVELVNISTGVRRIAVTNTAGQFRFPSVSVGDYQLSASCDDFFKAVVEDIRVSIGKGRNIQFVLTAMTETTTVDELIVLGDRYSRVDLATTESSTTITKDSIDRMPIGRSMTSVALLTPGTLEGDTAFGFLSSFGGASVAENAYYVNGMNVTDFRSGLGFSSAPFDFYDEYEVKTGGFSAEFGRSTGGVVNAVTKSGGNEFEFGAGIIYTPQKLRSSSPDVYLSDGSLHINNHDSVSDSVRRQIYGSGPIIKEKLFFFAMYAPMKLDQQTFSPNNRTVTNGDNPFWGLKLDYWINENHLLEFTGFSDKVEGNRKTYAFDAQTAQIGEERGTVDYDFGGTTSILQYTGFLTSTLSVSALAGVNKYEASNRSPLDDNIVIRDFRTFPSTDLGNWVNFRTGRSEDERKMYRFDIDWQIANHNIRAGIDSETNNSFELQTMSGGEYWAYDLVSPGQPVNDGFGNVVPAGVTNAAINIIWDTGGSFDNESSAFYVQDLWRATDNLTFSLGLRNERYKNKNAVGEAFLSISDQWAPRLGFAWDFLGNGEAKLFATAGRYHLPMPTVVNLRLAGGEYYSEDWYELIELNADDTPVIGARFGGAVFSDGQVQDTRSAVDQSIEPMYQDEFILGYVSEIWKSYNAGVRGIYRDLGRTIEDIEISPALNVYASANGFENFYAFPFSAYALTNPGTNMSVYYDMDLDGIPDEVKLTVNDIGLPEATRKYRALELFVERRWSDNWFFHVSYTLAKSEGNHEGYVRSDNGQGEPGFTTNFDYPGLNDYSYGPLPNDRRHSLKLHGAWKFAENWQFGWNGSWTSGRPLNAFGVHPTDFLAAAYGPESFYNNGVPAPRGSQGRTPGISNLDLSLQYRKDFASGIAMRLVAHVFNVFNSASALELNEYTVDFFGQPDPSFGLPTSFQSPRFGRISLYVNY